MKSAVEVLRILRDPMLRVVGARRAFTRFVPRLQRGHLQPDPSPRSRPTALRSRQFVALMDARCAAYPVRLAPSLGPNPGRGDLATAQTRISSIAFDQSYISDANIVSCVTSKIRGSTPRRRSPRRVIQPGLISQFRYGAVTVWSVDLTPDSHPIDLDGRAQERIWMSRVLTEGFRHFNHYIPSRKSRIRFV